MDGFVIHIGPTALVELLDLRPEVSHTRLGMAGNSSHADQNDLENGVGWLGSTTLH